MARCVYGHAGTVIIARGDQSGGFADGLASSVLAGILNAPVLLTDSNTLPEAVIDVITDLGATEAVVLGGSKAISDQAAAALERLGLSVRRIGGKDRFETAALIAEEARNRGATADYAFVVNGFATADSMVAAPAAFRNGAPLLPVTGNAIPEATINMLVKLGISRVYIIGGRAVVGNSVENRLDGLLTVTRRLGGADRYATSVVFAETLFAGFNDAVVTGGRDENLADSIGSCIFGLPVLYVRANAIPDGTYSYLKTVIIASLSHIRIIGGTAAVGWEINNQLNNLFAGGASGDTTGDSGGGGSAKPNVNNIIIETDPEDTGNLDNAGAVTVTLSTATAGAKIYYTLDGTAPTKNSNLYDGPFTVSTDDPAGITIPVKAIGIRSGYHSSAVATRNIVFNEEVDKSALTAAIAAAENNLASVEISADGSDVDPADRWVAQTVYDEYQTAIGEAQAVADNENAGQQEVNNAVSNLAAATTAFNNAKEDGTKPAPLRVAVYVDYGANPDKILAVMRCLQACGFNFGGISRSCIEQGRLNSDNYNVFLIPAGTDDLINDYESSLGLGTATIKNNIKTFVSNGGGIVGLENGARFISTGGSYLGLYPGTYTKTGTAGKVNLTLAGSFGNKIQQVYRTAGGGYFSTNGATTPVATVSGQAVVAHCNHGSGRVIVTSFSPELRGDTDLDWTRWDNWEMNGSHSYSFGAWELLGRMVKWAGTGEASLPEMTDLSNPAGKKIAVVSTYTKLASTADCWGGASAALLPAVFRSIEYAGHTPLAIRMIDIYNYGGGSLRLKTANFDALVIPGGQTGGYAYWLGRAQTGGIQYIRNFAISGGGVMGICAGSYYLSKTMNWEGTNYTDGYAGLFTGTDTGPIDAITPYPGYALAEIAINDPVIGITGMSQQQIYYGGGYKTNLGTATQVATYSALTPNQANAIRLKYGQGQSQGPVFLIGTHPELRCGSNEDWLHWDNYAYNSNTPLNNPDNTWDFLAAVFNNWLAP